MRKVVLYTLMSLDGDVDDPAGYFSPEPRPGQPPLFDAEMEEYETRSVNTQDAVLLGRHMYDEWSGFWPKVHDQPFAEFINNVKKYVVTSTPLTAHWHNAEAVSGPIDDIVRDLKGRDGGDIGVHGSIELAQSLLEHGLVDELQLIVGPSFGFTGRRLFARVNDVRRPELVNAAATSRGSLLLTYRMD